METLLAFVVGALFTAGVYLILRRNTFKLIMGLVLISQGANLLIFAAGGLTRAKAPVIAKDASVLTGPFADPLPQALILTAIVISFAVLAFSLVLIFRAWKTIDVNDVDQMKGELD